MKLKISLAIIMVVALLNCNSIGKENHVTPPRNKKVPLLTIKTDGKIRDEPKTNGNLKIWVNDSLILDSKIGIELRGAVSQMMYEKKSYGFELRSDSKKSREVSLLGLPANSDWVLHGPYGDKTLLRNAVAYKLSNEIGKYAARTKFVEVEINDDYLGMYVLMEKLKRDESRINIAKLTKKDSTDDKITGGYIIKIDKTVGDGNGDRDYNDNISFRSQIDQNGRVSRKSKTYFVYDYPKADDITPIQKNYIQKYINDFENALASADFKDPQKGYRNFIDVSSFIDFFILTELFQNHDGYRLSTYLQKDRGKKLAMGPIWDFDIAFGSDNGFCDGMNRHAWVFEYNKYCGGDAWLVPFWWKKLISDDEFKAELKERWSSLRKSQLSDNQLDKTIDDYNKYITENGLVARNFDRWDILNERITPNSTKGSHEKEIKRMKSWLKEHAHWIDENIEKL
ncbi:MAG: CotH kinase family protein [Spirosomataceae bacterium]